MKKKIGVVSFVALVLGLILISRIFWVGLAALIVAAVGVVIIIASNPMRVKMLWYRLGADMVEFKTYQTNGSKVLRHEIVSRPGFLGGRKYILACKASEKTEFKVEVEKGVYTEVEDGAEIKISALEYRVFDTESPRGRLQHRVFTDVKKVG
ncbi:hypothetical protein IJH02_02540 [Candidatus Saccharibacteria bacterium]|nr:hypothetical protein [Candidatus Saccharibacteria bacterium]